MNISLLCVFLFIYNLNLWSLLLNIFFWLNIVKLKNYVEKQLIFWIWEELFVHCDIITVKKVVILLDFSLKNIFIAVIQILDAFSYSIKWFYIILQDYKNIYYNKINYKNNRELHRFLS